MWDDLEKLAALPPWLRVLDEPEVVRAALVRSVPDFRSGAFFLGDVEDVELERARNKKGIWNVHYRLSVEDSEGETTVFLVQGVLYPPASHELDDISPSGTFGTDGWRGVVAELGLALAMEAPEKELASFPVLMDPESARAILERGIREHSPYTDIRIRACVPKLVRYKAGSRCTILYRLDYAPESRDPRWPDAVAVKTYHGHKGRSAWEGMHALWDSELRESGAVTIAEPLAFMADLNVLIQGPVPGDSSLHDVLVSALQSGSGSAMEKLRTLLRVTAAGLAALHGCGVTYGEEATWGDEIADVRDKAGRLAGAAPGIEETLEAVLRRLEELAVVHPPQPPLPCHRSFRPHQVLVHNERAGFIDFDGFCHAEPALDVALFRATLKYVGMGLPRGKEGLFSRDALLRRLSILDELCDVFLDEYEKLASISRERVALYETLALLTSVLHCWMKVRPERLEGSVIALERHLLDSVMAHGEAADAQGASEAG
jgi:Phosphotransferase enzyme family